MKKLIFTLPLLLLIYTPTLFAQKVISGKSNPVRLRINTTYKRGMPPNLYVNLNFKDDNNNGILEADEHAVLTLRITNKGKGPAQGLKVSINDSYYDSDLQIKDGKKIPFLYPGQSVDIDIPINAGLNIKTAEHKLKISVKEHFGYDMDDAYLILNTMAYQEPKIVFSGLEIVDAGPGTAAIISDGQLQAGEMVKVKLVVQNIGKNVSLNSLYKITSDDENIYLMNNKGNLNNIAIGETKEIWFTLSPNKRVTTTQTLPVRLSVTNKYRRGTLKNYLLPIKLNKKPPEPNIVQVKPDLDRLQKQVARFEYTSNKITANVANVIDINVVPHTGMYRPNSVAIVIGVEKYDNFAPAPYAANDAQIMKKYFKRVLGVDKVYLYTDEQVSGFFFDNIFNPDYGELQKAIVKGKTDLFVFYSGHGMPSKDGSKVYLFPSDGRIEALDRQGYDLNVFYNNLEKLGAKSTTVFLDACFSGVSRTSDIYETKNLIAMKGVSIKPVLKKPWEKESDFNLFASSSFDETSLGFDPSQTGLFTYFLCTGLQGNADINKDGKITTGELSEYIKNNVTETSVKILGKQTPSFHGNSGFVLTKFK